MWRLNYRLGSGHGLNASTARDRNWNPVGLGSTETSAREGFDAGRGLGATEWSRLCFGGWRRGLEVAAVDTT
ncbi:hypothetical protein M0R45_006732 [Rubus argutus]|uniref:Uncharacterized protein n=1 Tax=Rubus argutus TaxID=59490 RepID=A0AAW1YRZ0_RUBAR